jgi:hypothetical protein
MTIITLTWVAVAILIVIMAFVASELRRYEIERASAKSGMSL